MKGRPKSGFPLHHSSGIAEVTNALALPDVPVSPRLKKPREAIRQNMPKEGTWILESSLNDEMLADVEEEGKPGKSMTCFGRHDLQHSGTGP